MEPAANGTQTEPLGKGWTIATTAIGIFAALIGLGGMILSFRAVSAEMIPAFGIHWAWLVPLVIDLTVFAFSGVDLVLTRHGMSHPLARFTVYAATVGTVWLNYDAGGDTPGRVAHVLMPLIWVLFIEILRHVVRRKAHLAGAEIREPIPAARWLLSPVPTALLYRRMVLWQVYSYRAALAHERKRLRKIAALREEHGRWWWFHVAPIVRLELNLGPDGTPPAGPTEPPRGTVEPGPGGTHGTVPEPSHGTGVSGSTQPVPQPAMERPAEPGQTVPVPRSTPRATRSRATAAKRSEATVTSIVPNPDWPEMAKTIVATQGADVPLAVIREALGCSKSTASRLRGEAVAAMGAKPADEPESDPEREQEAS